MLENFDSVRLNHGLMESGYLNHQSILSDPTSAAVDEQKLSVSMTATMDAMGNLLLGKVETQLSSAPVLPRKIFKWLRIGGRRACIFFSCTNQLPSTGSSREFVGYNTEVDETVIDCIWKRAGDFFPRLREISLSEIRKSGKVRVGLRPYSKS